MLNRDLLDKISYKFPPTWKIPFYEFIGGKINLVDFEKEIYKTTELEVIIGEEIYIELVSFNYTYIRNYNDVVNYIFEKILIEESVYDCKLYVLISRFYSSDISQKLEKAKNIPEAVIIIFEGAHININVNWQGVDSPAYGIEFFQKINMFEWDSGEMMPLSTVEIAYTHDHEITLLMDNEGKVYFDFRTVNVTYYGGEFFDALKLLFFGLGYGQRIYPPLHSN
jgi:hypothetical protein